MKTKYILFILLLSVMPDLINSTQLYDKGVSLDLAQFRKNHYKNVRYDLGFSIPELKNDTIHAHAEILILLEKKVPVILDFTGKQNQIKQLLVNNRLSDYIFENQHIIIPEKDLLSGTNSIHIAFKAGDQSLNRREDFVYTLLVPDRARTLFPCFDQPDLKANFKLQLEVPDLWQAIGNGSIQRTETVSGERKKIYFSQTEPVSTYLFSFVAGTFNRLDNEKNGRRISLYHRETDNHKKAQCNDILDEVFYALEWMEEYTGVPYPFEKYDLIILPGFQYGGMEHMGATLYNDRRMFLEQNATPADSLSRSSLIAHETAHMWFGDYVTMEWFNDVWNKEVFANWFAAQIVSPLYPHINHQLNFIMSYYPTAYSQDRTAGTTPVQQPLENLNNAGLIYNNVVYNKSPIVMEMLVKKIGKHNFREAIQEYLQTYAYGNSGWDGLINILDSKTSENLFDWSNTWIKEKGMPAFSFDRNGDSLIIKQEDPWDLQRFWPVEFTVNINTVNNTADICFVKFSNKSELFEVPISDKSALILPNWDGMGYGYFKLDSISADWLIWNWGNITQPVPRFSMLMNCMKESCGMILIPKLSWNPLCDLWILRLIHRFSDKS